MVATLRIYNSACCLDKFIFSPNFNASAKTLEETERETIRQALENNGGRRKDTARELNISERTLYRKIKDFGLE